MRCPPPVTGTGALTAASHRYTQLAPARPGARGTEQRAGAGSAWRLLIATTLAACLCALASAPTAFAHAQLLGTSPQSGSTVPIQPAEVIFKFNQNVGGTLGA